MFLIDKYNIKNPWDVIYNIEIYKRLLKLKSLSSWYTDLIEPDDKFTVSQRDTVQVHTGRP